MCYGEPSCEFSLVKENWPEKCQEKIGDQIVTQGMSEEDEKSAIEQARDS